jgi:hypothetical protein
MRHHRCHQKGSCPLALQASIFKKGGNSFNMAENREPKKFEKNLGRASDMRDSRVRNAVELRKNAQDERLKKGRGMRHTHIQCATRISTTNPVSF